MFALRAILRSSRPLTRQRALARPLGRHLAPARPRPLARTLAAAPTIVRHYHHSGNDDDDEWWRRYGMTSDPSEPEPTPPIFLVFFPFILGVSYFFSLLSRRHEAKAADDNAQERVPARQQPRWSSRMVLTPSWSRR